MQILPDRIRHNQFSKLETSLMSSKNYNHNHDYIDPRVVDYLANEYGITANVKSNDPGSTSSISSESLDRNTASSEEKSSTSSLQPSSKFIWRKSLYLYTYRRLIMIGNVKNTLP